MTRHNLGFMVAEELARKWSFAPFKRGLRIKGKMTAGLVDGQKVHLLMPSTYMNLSGQAVRKAMSYYKIEQDNVLIIVDDVYLKLGTMRVRPKGSAGGHNGLKSIEASMQSQDYARLRMGVGSETLPEHVLEAFVLGNFTAEEQKKLPEVMESGISVTECWLAQGNEPAMEMAGKIGKQ